VYVVWRKAKNADGMGRPVCACCGDEHAMRRGGGIVALSPVVKALRARQPDTDCTGGEPELARMRKDSEGLEEWMIEQ